MLPYLIPFGIALAVAGIARLLAGPANGARYAGLSIIIGFAAAWQWLLLAPWVPFDALSRVIHIAIGGTLIGVAFEFFNPIRPWRIGVTAVYIFGCVWATVTGALLGAPPDGAGWLRLALYLLLWGVVLAKLNRLKREGPSALVILTMLAFGLGVVAQMSGDGAAGATAYALAAACAGFLVLCWVLALAVGDTVVLGAGGAGLAVAMALLEPSAEAPLIAILLLILVPFADGTARRLPLGPAALRPAVYPLALTGVCLLPVVLAGVLALLLSQP